VQVDVKVGRIAVLRVVSHRTDRSAIVVKSAKAMSGKWTMGEIV
jgi:uncharacterized protein with FMN-binding domain